ncbi:MAG: hypothetical protein Q9226_007321 [Calogaya cf. arnoldii]
MLFANETYSTVPRPERNVDGGQAPALAVPNNLERRWFKGVSAMLLYTVARHPKLAVSSDFPRGTTGIRIHHVNCAPEEPNNEDQIDISMYPRDPAIPEWEPQYDTLAKALLVLGTRVAAEGAGWDAEQVIVKRRGVVTADIVTAALRIRVKREEQRVSGTS